MSGGGVIRVSIPHNARKVIQEVKKAIGSKLSEEFVYTTLKDCDMDPKEAGRRLKMIHDIIEIAGKHNVEDVYTMLKDCNMDPNEAAQRLLYIDTFHEVKKKHDRRKSISSDISEDFKRTQGNQWRRNLSSGKEHGATNRQERVSKLIIPVHSGEENNGAHVANSVANGNGTLAISNGSYSHKLAPESSSTSDTVVVSSKHTCAVGTIQCEIVKRSGSTKSNSRLPTGIKFSGDQVVADSIPVIADYDNARQVKSDVVEKVEISESLKPLSLSTSDSSQVVSPNQDKQPSPLLHEPPLKVIASENTIISINNTDSIPEEKSELIPSGDVAVEKSTPSSTYQPVIFPDHLQVPENYKNHFTFGSIELDATPDDSQPLSVTESVEQNEEMASLKEEDNISSDPDPVLKHDETKVEVKMLPPPPPNGLGLGLGLGGGFQNPIVQREYSFGYMPHLMGLGPHFVHVDLPELQNGSGGCVVAASGLGETQAATVGVGVGVGQNCISLSPSPPPPPVFPYFRQVFPSYIPYNPYFPHLYLPQNAHHMFNNAHGVFPTHQLSPTSPSPSTGVVKFPVPQLKQGTPNPNQDLTVSQLKSGDNNLLHLHPPLQQGENGQVWAREVVPNYFYNFPPQAQGHAHHMHMGMMGFSALQAPPGIYQSATVQPPLMYQSQSTATTNTIEPLVPPQHNWNNTLLNREKERQVD